MRFAKHLSIAAGVIAVAMSAVATRRPRRMTAGSTVTSTTIVSATLRRLPSLLFPTAGHLRRPVMYREAPMYYAPMGPPSLNVIIPLR